MPGSGTRIELSIGAWISMNIGTWVLMKEIKETEVQRVIGLEAGKWTEIEQGWDQ